MKAATITSDTSHQHPNILLIIAAVFGGLRVAIGAFATHSLKSILTEQAMGWMNTGVQYQQFHALALLAVAILWKVQPSWNLLKQSGWSFIIGMVLFSGSLYAMAATDVRALGMITPIGGLAFLLGWLLLVVACWRGNADRGNAHDR